MKFFYLIFLLFLFACGNEKQKVNMQIENGSAGVEKSALPAKGVKISGLNFKFKPNIKETAWKGNIVEAACWQDSNGKNVIIISDIETDDWEQTRPELKKLKPKDGGNDCSLAELFAYHYILPAPGDRWKRYWQLNDFEFHCGSDRNIRYKPKSLLISDVDSNGIAENCFMYYENFNNIDLHYTVKMILHTDSIKLKVYGEIGLYKQIIGEWNKSLLVPKYTGFDKVKPEYYKLGKQLWNRYSKQQDSIDNAHLKEWGLK